MARRARNRNETRWVDASESAAVVALLRADDPEGAGDPELVQLLERNLAVESSVTVGAYPRISEYRPERGNRGGDIGVVRQAKAILRYCTDRGIRIGRFYVDNDFTASDPKRPRPAYTKLFTDLRAGVIGGIVAWDLIRVYRQYREFQDLLDLVDERPAIFVATTEGDLNLTTEGGRLLAGIYVLVGAMESALISKRVRNKVDARAKAGLWNGGNVPYGYRRTDRKGALEPDPVEADTVRRIAELVLAGEPLERITRTLKEEGRQRRDGRPWHPSTIRAMMLNPLYAGWRVHQPREKHGRRPLAGEEPRKYRAKGWPAILTDADMALLEALLKNPERNRRPAHGSERVYDAAGLLTCGREGCDGRIGSQPRYYPNGIVKRSYACKTCHLSRDADAVESYILALLWEHSEQDPNVGAVLADESGDDMERVRGAQALARVQADLEVGPALLEEGEMTLFDWNRAQKALRKREAELLNQLRPKAFTEPVPKDKLEVWETLSRTERYGIIRAFLDGHDFELVLLPQGKGHRKKYAEKKDPGLVLRRRADDDAAQRPRGRPGTLDLP